ncbi:MAG: DUF3552 domain-containing protein, partial [Clostridia bacterium]|nr:DUF3552 domain-containing protein [Clostridia bacterium]
MSDVLIGIIAAVSGLGIGALGGYKYRRNLIETKIGRSEKFAEEQLQEAVRKSEEVKAKADEYRKEQILATKEEILSLKDELDREVKDRRN